MMFFSSSFKLSACALAASVLISACGGGTESTDKVPPTVAITAAAGASGTAVFTFVFSEDVGTSFVAEDIVVTSGTAGTLTQVNATTYSFVATPAGAGAVGVSLSGANFKDKALNVGVVGGTASYTVSQASGNTGSCTTTNCIGFEATNVGFVPFEGLVSAEVVADPADSGNKVAKLVKGPNGQPWAGVTIFTTDATLQTITPINFASAKLVTMRVYSGAAGNKIRLKIETGPNAGGIEVDATTTKANEWETLTFDFGTPTAGTFDATKVYKTVSIFPVFLTPVAADTVFYFDELKFPAAAPAVAAIDFSGSTVGFVPFEGLASATIANDPTDAGNKVAKIVKVASGQPWAGATVYTTDATAQAVTPIDFASSKVITMRSYASAVGQKIRLKVETGPNAGGMEVDALTTKANAWETLTFDFASPIAGSYDSSKVYNTISIFPMFLTPATADTTFYFDDLDYRKGSVSSGGGSGSGGTPSAELIYASNYSDTPTPWQSVQGGTAGRYIDDSVGAKDWWSGLGANDATPSFYFGYGVPSANKPWGFGAYVNAPANGVANVTGYTNLQIAAWGNDALVNSNPHFTVILKGPAVNNCQAELKGDIAVTAIGAQTYTLPLSGFSLQTACAYTSVAQALSGGVAQVHVQVLGNNLQYTTVGDPGYYANGLNIGPIKFK
jgi:hypothetical protein